MLAQYFVEVAGGVAAAAAAVADADAVALVWFGLVWSALNRFSYLLFHFLIYRNGNAYSYVQTVFVYTSYY